MIKVKAGFRDIWRIAYPIMLGSLAQTILGLTDTAFLARVGEIELGAVAIGSVFYFVLAMLGGAIGIGAQIIIARKSGEGKINEIGKIYDHTLLLLTGFSILIFAFILWGSPYLFNSFLHSENIAVATNEFMKYRSWGIIGVMISVSFRAFYIGIASTRVITYSAFLMTGLNILLAWAFIFGHLGFPAMGIGGAGLASAISESVSAIYLIIYSYLKNEFKIFCLLKFQKIEMKIFSGIMNLSAPIMLQHFISMASWFLFFLFIEKTGEHPLAISNIVRSTYMIMMTPVWGYASAANSMTSNLIGQGKSNEIMGLLKKIVVFSFFTSLIMVSFCIFLPGTVLKITTSDPLLIHDATGSLRVICGAMLLFSMSFVLFNGVSGTGNTKIAMMIEIGNIIMYLLYVYICAELLKASVEWVWVAEILYWLMMGLLSYLYLKSNHWKKIKLLK